LTQVIAKEAIRMVDGLLHCNRKNTEGTEGLKGE